MLTINLETENAAFGPTAEDRAHEVARILHDLARRIEREAAREGAGKLADLNGNACGRWELSAFDPTSHGYPAETDNDDSADASDVVEIECIYGRGSRAE